MHSELMMFYNLENFFPADSQQNPKSQSGLYNWTSYKYGLKVNRITNVFRFVKEEYGQLPSIIGLAEVGALSVLEDLTKDDSPLNHYTILYEKSQDLRGLSNAILYDSHKMTLHNFRTIRYQEDLEKSIITRDILHAEFSCNGENIHVFVVHLPSKRIGDFKKNKRNYILSELKKTLQSLHQEAKNIILMGDFNENPDSDGIQDLKYDQKDQLYVVNEFEYFFQTNQFTTYHHKKGMVFDQILYSKKLLENHLITCSIFKDERLRNKSKKENAFPIRTYSGSRYIGGYSDHFPILIKL